MGKQRRKFETGFKQQIIQEVESGLLSVSAASRKYQISVSVIDRWRRQARQGGLEASPSARAPYVRIDVAFGSNGKWGERAGKQSERAKNGRV